MSVHLNRFNELSTQVANLSANGLGVPDNDQVSMLCLSLPESYEPLIMAVQSLRDNLTFDLLCGRLLQEATQYQAARSTTTEEGSKPLSAFAAGSGFRSMGFRGRANGRGGNRGFGCGMRGGSSGGTRGRGIGLGMVSGRCHYCNREGHWKNEYFKRKAELQKGSSGEHLAFMGLSDK